MSYTTKTLDGFCIIADIFDERGTDPKRMGAAISAMLTDSVKDEVCSALFYMSAGHQPTCEADLQLMAPRYEQTKEVLRQAVVDLFKAEPEQDHAMSAVRKAEVLQELKSHNQPSEFGTVAEISAKYGISKSEVRRRKAEGTLHELIQKG